MAFAEWMVVRLSLEEELEIERKVREPYETNDIVELRDSCSALIRKVAIQEKLLKQAADMICEWEVKAVLEPVKQPIPRRKSFLNRLFD